MDGTVLEISIMMASEGEGGVIAVTMIDMERDDVGKERFCKKSTVWRIVEAFRLQVCFFFFFFWGGHRFCCLYLVCSSDRSIKRDAEWCHTYNPC